MEMLCSEFSSVSFFITRRAAVQQKSRGSIILKTTGEGIDDTLIAAIGSLKPDMNLDIHHKKTVRKGDM